MTGIERAAAAAQVDEPSDSYRVPKESWLRLFLRFLRFGALAWGGPVAQSAMIRQELVDEERWISSAHFNRVLAVYQVLPGPEAHELCVYFGFSRSPFRCVNLCVEYFIPFSFLNTGLVTSRPLNANAR